MTPSVVCKAEPWESTPEGRAHEVGERNNVAQSFTNLLYHVLFSTKARGPLVTAEIESRLHEYLGGLVKARGGIPLAIHGMPDHVHLLVKLR